MIEALLLMAFGAGLARVTIAPVQVAIQRRQERLDEERAARLLEDFRRGAPQVPDVAA